MKLAYNMDCICVSVDRLQAFKIIKLLQFKLLDENIFDQKQEGVPPKNIAVPQVEI